MVFSSSTNLAFFLFLLLQLPSCQVKWRTIAGSAIDGEDFEGAEGELIFTSGVTSMDISINVINNMNAAGEDENFEVGRHPNFHKSFLCQHNFYHHLNLCQIQVELYELDVEGAKIGEPKKTTVTIADDDEFQEILDNMMKLTNENLAGPHDQPPDPDPDL